MWLERRLLPIKWAWQRLTRGWDDRALGAIDSWMHEKLAEMLPRLAEVSHGWPAEMIEGEDGIPVPDPSFTFEDWQQELRDAGERFRRLAVGDFYDEEADTWHLDAEAETYEEAWDWFRKRISALWD